MTPTASAAFAACLVLVLVHGVGVGACANDAPPVDSEPAEAGRVIFPLVVSGGSHQYRLASVYVVIYGPQSVQLTSSDDPGEMALAATLQTGSYMAYLFGWTLERDDGAGGFQAVPASLVSSSSVAFRIFNGATSTISYSFQTDGVIVTVGAGNLKVTATVNEIPAACTPFGADCSEGTWCPPTALTGAPRACISAGSASIGDPCLSPLDCVANASCVDTANGHGSVCLALCPEASFETPCSTGGTCQPAGPAYGLCRPPTSPTP